MMASGLAAHARALRSKDFDAACAGLLAPEAADDGRDADGGENGFLRVREIMR